MLLLSDTAAVSGVATLFESLSYALFCGSNGGGRDGRRILEGREGQGQDGHRAGGLRRGATCRSLFSFQSVVYYSHANIRVEASI